MDIEDIQVIDINPVSQSSGRVMDGGDCGYCCVAGLFKVSIKEAYELVESLMPEGNWKLRESMTAYRMKLFLEAKGIEYKEFLPEFDHYKAGVMPLMWNNGNWFKDFRELIKEDSILFASVRYNRSVPPPPRSHMEHDHVVLVNGYRTYWKDHPTVEGARSLMTEVQVSCSAKGKRWIDWEEFLYWHGCAGIVIPTKNLS